MRDTLRAVFRTFPSFGNVEAPLSAETELLHEVACVMESMPHALQHDQVSRL